MPEAVSVLFALVPLLPYFPSAIIGRCQQLRLNYSKAGGPSQQIP